MLESMCHSKYVLRTRWCDRGIWYFPWKNFKNNTKSPRAYLISNSSRGSILSIKIMQLYSIDLYPSNLTCLDAFWWPYGRLLGAWGMFSSPYEAKSRFLLFHNLSHNINTLHISHSCVPKLWPNRIRLYLLSVYGVRRQSLRRWLEDGYFHQSL